MNLTVVIPIHNEEPSILPLYDRLTAVMEKIRRPYEIIFVDDASNDRSFDLLANLVETDGRLKVVRLRRNFGQTAALAAAARGLFHAAWSGKPIRLLGVYAQSLEKHEGQTSLLEEPRAEGWRKALGAVDKIREKYGDDSIVSLAAGMSSAFRARVHENPENLPGKDPKAGDSEPRPRGSG